MAKREEADRGRSQSRSRSAGSMATSSSSSGSSPTSSSSRGSGSSSGTSGSTSSGSSVRSASRSAPKAVADVDMKDTSKGQHSDRSRSNGKDKAATDTVKETPKKQEDDKAGMTRLVVTNLTRNVTEEHVREIFSSFGDLTTVDLLVDKVVNLPRGFAHVEYQRHADAQKAVDYMHLGQVDGNVIKVSFVIQPRRRSPPPPPKLPPPPPRLPSPPREGRDYRAGGGASLRERDRERERERARDLDRDRDRGRDRDRDDRDRGRPPPPPPPPRLPSLPRRYASPPRRRRSRTPPRGLGAGPRRPSPPVRRRSPSRSPRRRSRSPVRGRGSPIRRRSPSLRRRPRSPLPPARGARSPPRPQQQLQQPQQLQQEPKPSAGALCIEVIILLIIALPLVPFQQLPFSLAAAQEVPVANIRNFSIIAHIDHGKSTLADQLLLKTGTVAARDMVEQFMDSNEIERERGITIKLNTARMKYTASDGQLYALNLIDTPGHVDFTYEVSRSLQACEGALLVVDASQGVEAQTLANVWLALENDLEIIPVLNKIDLPGAEPERVIKEIEDIIGLDCTNILRVSAKQGIGIEETLEAVVQRIPPPPNQMDKPLRALIFDSYYDPYRGVVCQFRVVDGAVSKGDTVVMMNTGKEYTLDEVGVLAPGKTEVDTLYCGEVGYLAAQIKSVQDARVGDTVTMKKGAATEPLEGYEDVQPMVYCGLFPTDSDDYQNLREALEKLQLNDAALKFEPEVSSAMGFGFRCGFLGLLHMEIVQERLEREYNLGLITTAPTVVYKCTTSNGEELTINSPGDLPEASKRESISEPYVRLEMVTPTDYVGNLMELANNRRGEFVEMRYLTESRTTLVYNIPLAEVVTDYFDQLKSRSKGYASMEYKITGYRVNDLVKLEIKINGEPAEPLSCVVHRDAAYRTGRALVSKLKELIPRQMFRVPIQACIGVKVIASEAIAPYRKDVLAKCYGGDISRKKKLLQKQAEGKKRMKALGKVEVPQEAFMAVLKLGDMEE